MYMKKLIPIICVMGLAIAALCSCEKSLPRLERTKKVFIIYSCGFNNLNGNLLQDINEICETSPALAYDGYYKIFVLSHRVSQGGYSEPVAPVLMQVYRNRKGEVVRDTLHTYPGRTGSDASLLKEVLTRIHADYPADEYGFLFTSHGTGWLPFDYYAHGSKTVGSDFGPVAGGGTGSVYEMDVTDFAAAFPMKMKYVLMDACYASCVELAYEMRNVCDYLVASPTEILDDGLVYTSMLKHLLHDSEPDLEGLCRAYMDYYKSRIASITLVDCSYLDQLAAVCKTLFEKYRTEMANVNEKNIQAYFRRTGSQYTEKHWFYDLEDIIIRCGASNADLAALHNALENAVLYADATDRLFGDTVKEHVCGLGMYLPKMGTPYLDDYYRSYAWNKDTGLVK